MVSQKSHRIPAVMERARRRFERWRRTRSTASPASPIPESLWALAVKLAAAHGTNKTALALRLNHTALKKRLQAAGEHAGLQPPLTRFIELAPSPAALPACTIELENAQGAKMRIHLAKPESLDLVALSRSLWGAKP